jgi:DNA-binding response OmpR family regulator
MPELDGYEMCRRLKADAKTASIPVLVLTAVPASAVDARAQDLGVARILHKPFDSTELVAAVREIVGTRS